jgi:hypothetical protein
VNDGFQIAASIGILKNKASQSGSVQFAVGPDHTEPEPRLNLLEYRAACPLNESNQVVR